MNKKHQIRTIAELKENNLYKLPNLVESPFEYFMPELKPDIEPALIHLLEQEYILSQRVNQYKTGIPSLYQRDYSFKDMLKTQSILETLDLLESIKYAAHYTNTRKLLQRYLHTKYDLSSCNLLQLPKDNTISTHMIIKPDNLILYNQNFLTLKMEVNQPSPSKSIRNQLSNFIFSVTGSDSPCVNSILFKKAETEHGTDTIQTSNEELKERFYLSAYEIPKFLLLFTYYDGRDFNNTYLQRNPDKLPRHKKDKSFSEFSYCLVIEKLKLLYPTSSEYLLQEIATFVRCDNMFLYSKLNRLTYYYDLYLSDLTLDTIVSQCKFTYSQVLCLK